MNPNHGKESENENETDDPAGRFSAFSERVRGCGRGLLREKQRLLPRKLLQSGDGLLPPEAVVLRGRRRLLQPEVNQLDTSRPAGREVSLDRVP